MKKLLALLASESISSLSEEDFNVIEAELTKIYQSLYVNNEYFDTKTRKGSPMFAWKPVSSKQRLGIAGVKDLINIFKLVNIHSTTSNIDLSDVIIDDLSEFGERKLNARMNNQRVNFVSLRYKRDSETKEPIVDEKGRMHLESVGFLVQAVKEADKASASIQSSKDKYLAEMRAKVAETKRLAVEAD